MTDDLVKRLRDVQENWPWCEIELEAADRIETLEAALREICDGPRDVEKSYAELFAEVCAEARAAIAGTHEK